MNIKELKSLKRKVDVDIENMRYEHSKIKTNHILHIILSLLTGGLWLLIWLFSSHTNTKKQQRLEKDIRETQEYLFEIEDRLDELSARR